MSGRRFFSPLGRNWSPGRKEDTSQSHGKLVPSTRLSSIVYGRERERGRTRSRIFGGGKTRARSHKLGSFNVSYSTTVRSSLPGGESGFPSVPDLFFHKVIRQFLRSVNTPRCALSSPPMMYISSTIDNNLESRKCVQADPRPPNENKTNPRWQKKTALRSLWCWWSSSWNLRPVDS